MKKEIKVILGVVAIVVVGFTAAFMIYRGQQSEGSSQSAGRIAKEQLVTSDAWSLGPTMARVTLVEFFDPECESCAAFHPMVKRVLAEFPNGIRYVVRYMPFHGNSEYAATALEAAGLQGKYWEALEALFARQPEWGSHHDPRPELIPEILAGIGLDRKQLEEDMKRPEFTAKVRKDKEEGLKIGVRATPTFFINGQPLQQLSFEAFMEAIQQEMGTPSR